jgi:hypothetical protein
MNIIKLQNMLRGVPDDALIGYVQNPQGEVPSYLALSELQRRKDTRAKYQAEQAPETSVAEDLGQETMSDQGGLAMLAGQPQMQMEDQGVAGLPVDDNMYDEENFAGGGIVAFDDGGDVKHYKKGDYVLSSDYDPEAYGVSYREGLAGLDTKYPVYSTTDPYGNVRKKAIKEYKSSVKTPYDDAIRYYEEQGLGYKGKFNAVPYTTPVRKLENARDEWLASQGTMPTTPVTKPSNEPDVRLTGDPTTEKQTGQRSPVSGFNANVYDKMLNKEKTLQELSDEYKATLGADPTLPGRQEKLAKMEARAKRMEDTAPGMAMLEAGLGIAAGTSPFALANIGQGAMAGVKSYGEAQNRLAQLEERRFALDTELAKQQRAEQMAAMNFGERSRQHTEQINKTIMLAKEKDRLTREMTREEIAGRTDAAIIRSRIGEAPKVKDVAEARAAYQNSPQQKKDIERIIKENKLGDNAVKPSSPRYPEFIQKLKIAEEEYLANYFSPIGSNMPRASTQGFEITNP